MFYELSRIGTSDYFRKEQGEKFSFPPHLHQCFELILVTSGSMDIIINGQMHTLEKNQAVLVFPNQIHSLRSINSKHTLFIFSPQFIQAYWAEKSNSLPIHNAIALDDYTVQRLLSLTSESSKFEIKGVFYSICAVLDKSTSFQKNIDDSQTLLFKILGYIEKNFAKDCALSALAASVGYNSEYISRFFKHKMNMPYNQYLNIRRLNHAAYLLQNTNETALNCALESGYTSLRTFNRNFKLYYGMTPQEYRNKRLPQF